MDLRDYLRTLRKRWLIVLLCTVLATGAAVGATMLMTPVYEAKTQLFVSTTGGGNVADAYQGTLFTQQRVKSYADIVSAPSVTRPVVDNLGLRGSPGKLAHKISTEVPLDTVLINISVQDTDPARARNIANAVSAEFAQVVTELETPENRVQAPVKVSLVKPAGTPRTPVSPRPLVNVALGVLVGLAVGVGAAVLRETLDTSVRNPDDLAEITGRPLLGTVAYDQDAPRQPLIVHADPRASRAEAFRTLRTNLQFVNVDNPPRSVVVTSAVSEEGKSTTAANLAIALAQSGMRVALLEADLRRPSLAGYMRVEGAVGLTDVLVGRAPLGDVLQPWGREKLYVLPCGAVPPNPSELLGSQHMARLLGELLDRVDFVVVDAPPLLPVTDAAVLARVCDGAVLVARHRRVRREHVAASVAALETVGARLLGTVLTMAPTKGPDAVGYGSAYGYRYEQREPGPAIVEADGRAATTPAAKPDASSSDGRARHASARR